MYPSDHLILASVLLHQQELQAEAERRRLLRDSSEASVDAAGGPLIALRRAVGSALVQAGERVRGAKQVSGGARLRPAR